MIKVSDQVPHGAVRVRNAGADSLERTFRTGLWLAKESKVP
jgi:hypothetical protein